MKLYITIPSPYARKCRVVAREKGLIERIEEIAVDPYANAPELLAANPLVQVPTLIAGDGQPLNDSPVICEYLDAIGSGPRLLPEGGAERLRVRRLETLANGALEMGVKLVLEKRRPEHERRETGCAVRELCEHDALTSGQTERLPDVRWNGNLTLAGDSCFRHSGSLPSCQL